MLYFFQERPNIENLNNLNEILDIYDNSDELFAGFQGVNSKDYDKKLSEFEKNITEVNKIISSNRSNADNLILILAHLTKANILLRKGQICTEDFQDPRNYYDEANGYLEKALGIYRDKFQKIIKTPFHEKTQEDEKWIYCTYLLTKLNKGKFFRNIAIYENDHIQYKKALKIFHEVNERASNAFNDDAFLRHIKLDSLVNKGRVYKSLYQFNEAYDVFEEMIEILIPQEGEKKLCKQLVEKLKKEAFDGIADILNENLSASLCNARGTKLQNKEMLTYLLQVILYLGIILRKSLKDKEIIEAKPIFKFMIKLDENNLDARNNLLLCYRKSGDSVNAEAIIKEIKVIISKDKCEQNVKNRFTNIQNLKLLITQENTEVDSILAAHLEKNGKDPQLRLLKGICLKKERKYNAAILYFESLHKDFPSLDKGTFGLKAYYNLAHCYYSQKRYYAALEICNEIILANNDETYVLLLYGRCLQKMSLTSKVMQDFFDIFKSNVESREENISKRFSEENRYQVYCSCGICYLKLGENKNAYTYFEKALDYNKEQVDVEVYAYLGITQLKLKEHQKAKEYLEFALSIDSMHLDANNYLILCYYELKKKSKRNEKDRKKYVDLIEDKLKNSSCSYSLRVCEIFLEIFNRDEKLYAFSSNIRIDPREEGAKAFESFFKTAEINKLEPLKKGYLMCNLLSLYSHITKIKETCRLELKDDGKYVHYSRIESLKKMLSIGDGAIPRFRLNNILYMNDPFEGEQFFELIKKATKLKDEKTNEDKMINILHQYFLHLKKPNYQSDIQIPIKTKGNIYISSLSSECDNLQMWVHYANRGAGCQIEFDKDFFDLTTSVSDDKSWHLSLQTNEYPLYAVQYIGGDDLQNKELVEHFYNIFKCLKKIDDDFSKDDEGDNKDPLYADNVRNLIFSFSADRLNEIRFLFKHPEYSYEKEVRVITYSENPKIDESYAIPHLYVEVDREIRMNEVQLGPKVSSSDANEIAAWLHKTGKVKTVISSKRHYK